MATAKNVIGFTNQIDTAIEAIQDSISTPEVVC